MPRYDFQCEDGHVTEETFTFADVPPDIKCPHCDKEAKRQLSAGLMFQVNKVMSPPSKRLRFDPGH